MVASKEPLSPEKAALAVLSISYPQPARVLDAVLDHTRNKPKQRLRFLKAIFNENLPYSDWPPELRKIIKDVADDAEDASRRTFLTKAGVAALAFIVGHESTRISAQGMAESAAKQSYLHNLQEARKKIGKAPASAEGRAEVLEILDKKIDSLRRDVSRYSGLGEVGLPVALHQRNAVKEATAMPNDRIVLRDVKKNIHEMEHLLTVMTALSVHRDVRDRIGGTVKQRVGIHPAQNDPFGL